MANLNERLRNRWDRIAPTRAFARRNRKIKRGTQVSELNVAPVDYEACPPAYEVRSTTASAYVSPEEQYWYRSPAVTPYSTTLYGDWATSARDAQTMTFEATRGYDFDSEIGSLGRHTISAQEFGELLRKYLNFDFKEDDSLKSKPCEVAVDLDKIFEE